MWPTFSFSFLIQFPHRWLLRNLKPQMQNSLKPSDAYLMLANRIQPSVLAPGWHKRLNSCSWLTVGFRRSTKCIVFKKAGSELSAPWHIHFLTSSGKVQLETELILTVPQYHQPRDLFFLSVKDYAFMTIAGELHAFWCPLQIKVVKHYYKLIYNRLERGLHWHRTWRYSHIEGCSPQDL